MVESPKDDVPPIPSHKSNKAMDYPEDDDDDAPPLPPRKSDQLVEFPKDNAPCLLSHKSDRHYIDSAGYIKINPVEMEDDAFAIYEDESVRSSQNTNAESFVSPVHPKLSNSAK